MKQSNLKPRLKSNVRPQDAILLVFLIFLLFALTMSVMMGTIQTRQKQIDSISDNLEIYSKNQKAHILQFIDNKVSFLKGLTQYPQINQMIPHQQRTFLKNKSEDFGFDYIFIVDNEGTGYYFDQGRYLSHSNDQFFRDIIHNDVFITEPHDSANGLTSTICVSIYNENIKQGALCGVVFLEDIASLFTQTTLPSQGESFLINNDGRYLVANDTTKVTLQQSIYDEPDSDTSLIKEAFAEQTDKKGIIRLHGVEYTAQMSYLPDLDWTIVQCIDNNAVEKEIRSLNFWMLCFCVIIVLIIFCIINIVIYWYQSITKLNTDSLTKCNSRIAIQSFIEQLEHDYSKSIAVVYFDLNKFKYINDTYGHDEGDRILIIFSNILVETFQEFAKVGRMGGDEFLAIALDINEYKLEQLANEVNQKLWEKKTELQLPYNISTSYGYAIRPQNDQTILYDIMKQADKNMYKYKEKIHRQYAP